MDSIIKLSKTFIFRTNIAETKSCIKEPNLLLLTAAFVWVNQWRELDWTFK